MTRPHWVTPEPEEVLGLWAARARASDPPTSHEAAKRAPVAGHCLLVLEALRAGPAGQTEIARRSGLLPHQANKRLSELCREGYVVLTGRKVVNDKGLQEREWRVA